MEETATNKFMSITYKMYTLDENTSELAEETTRKAPFEFITGMGLTLEAFETQMLKLEKGDEFDFIIPRGEAYGEYDDEHIYDLPKTLFYIDGKFDNERVVKDAILPMRTEDGQMFNGSVVEVKADSVVMDFNHPFAGCDLRFTGKVLESRPATNQELAQLANALTHHGCGGCGGGCNDGCGGGCDDGCCGGC